MHDPRAPGYHCLRSGRPCKRGRRNVGRRPDDHAVPVAPRSAARLRVGCVRPSERGGRDGAILRRRTGHGPLRMQPVYCELRGLWRLARDRPGRYPRRMCPPPQMEVEDALLATTASRGTPSPCRHRRTDGICSGGRCRHFRSGGGRSLAMRTVARPVQVKFDRTKPIRCDRSSITNPGASPMQGSARRRGKRDASDGRRPKVRRERCET